MSEFRLSHTKIQTFKRCPMQYRFRYECGIVPEEETESLRYGVNWHTLHEEVDKIETQWRKKNDEGTRYDAAMVVLNDLYTPATCPPSKTAEQWEVEKLTLYYAFLAHQWYYSQQKQSVQAREIRFDGVLLGNTKAKLEGIIDKISDYEGRPYVTDYKSTTHDVGPDSDYWGILQRSLQHKIYLYACWKQGIEIRGVLYDVWRRPNIRPRKLTIAETREFLNTGKYCGAEFLLDYNTQVAEMKINGQYIEFERSARNEPIIRETPAMYGARLFQDITKRPEYYFALHPVPVTVEDVENAEQTLIGIYKTILYMRKTNTWWCNEDACTATFKCPYLQICRSDFYDVLPPGLIRRRDENHVSTP